MTDAACLRDEENYQALREHYLKRPIALYTGAGVSTAKSPSPKKRKNAERDNNESDDRTPQFGLGDWNKLVRDVLEKHHAADSDVLQDFDCETNTNKEWRGKPWKQADWVAKNIGTESFKQAVFDIVRREDNFPERKEGAKKGYKQLGRPFLRNALTLNAVCAFCARLTAFVHDAKPLTFHAATNPRVPAILTSNYDPFLEAASSTMYRNVLLKPVAAKGSSVGRIGQTPVFHVHGYVPYPDIKEREIKVVKEPIVDPVVTTEDYKNAWEMGRPHGNKAYNFTMGPQVHILRHHCVLFVGFSFRDSYVNQLLTDLNKDRSGRKDRLYHYAVMSRKEVIAKNKNFFDELGVRPITLTSYDQMPAFFRHLYAEGLREDHRSESIPLRPVEKSAGTKSVRGDLHLAVVKKTRGDKKAPQPKYFNIDEYWDNLYWCRNCWVSPKTKTACIQQWCPG